MGRQIKVSIDVFAEMWAQRISCEISEDQILRRILGIHPYGSDKNDGERTLGTRLESEPISVDTRPKSKKWTHVLVWALSELGGHSDLSKIYEKTREGRQRLNIGITEKHDASARECLESHCSESKKFRHRQALFIMPAGKGAGFWALAPGVTDLPEFRD